MSEHADLLTADCGNSTIDCLRHGDRLRQRFDVRDLDPALLRSFVPAAVRRCVVAAVSPPALALLRAALAPLPIEVRVAGADLPCPLPIDYVPAEALGADRWVGALAAHRECGAAVVVDCGSATTVNLVAADGTFCGGAIAPGLQALVAGMASATPRLPAANLDAVPGWPPRSTQAALDTGVLQGWCGMVERLVAAAVAASGTPPTVLVTGGNAPRLLAHGRLRARHVADLVHRGLALLAAGGRWNS
jgi:type III pantothenate kinase